MNHAAGLATGAPSIAAASIAPISAASAVTIGRMYRSSFVPDIEKNTTIVAIQITSSLVTRSSNLSRTAHQIAAGISSDHGNRSASITGR